MFLPQFSTLLLRSAIGLGLLLGSATAALAQGAPASGTAAKPGSVLATLSAEAGLPFIVTTRAPPAQETPPEDPALCLRAGFGLSAEAMSGTQMTVEHGLLGCKTETAGLPITVSADPAMTPPPASRTGDYSLDLSLRYRVLRRKHLQVVATIAEQALAYSLTSPVRGNNVLASMSLLF
jgi:hypothetical protein